MDTPEKYLYKYRPAHGTDNLLIEFVSGPEKSTFGTDFLNAISAINPILTGHQDLWMNDETLYTIESDLGQFTMSKDIWDFVFIMAHDNQSCILQIHTILLSDDKFENIEVDFNNFKVIK